MIEVILNDRLGKKVRVKCNEDDTVSPSPASTWIGVYLCAHVSVHSALLTFSSCCEIAKILLESWSSASVVSPNWHSRFLFSECVPHSDSDSL